MSDAPPDGWSLSKLGAGNREMVREGLTRTYSGDSIELVGDHLEVGVCINHCGYFTEVPLSVLRAVLAAQGLHVVSAAEKAVLDAMSKASLADLQFLPGLDGVLDAVYYAELARREQKP